jgi:peptidoglycan/xylan/chitin deacetylase (PgdA/CDA1 family)
VFVASGIGFHDAVAGGPAAAVNNAPMLLVTPTQLPDSTRNQLARLEPAQIILLGSTEAVSPAVAAALETFAPVERVAGPDVATTAVEISQRFFGTGRTATFLATSDSFRDATAAIPPAGRARGPILWARGNTLRTATQAELLPLSPRTVYVLGGATAVGVPVVKAVQRVLGVCWSGSKPPVSGRQVITSVTSATRQIALTFDMGGRLVPAEQIVAYLAENQVCTTFFPTGAMAQSDAALPVMAAIARRPELFELGNHTMHHCDLVRGGGGSPTTGPCTMAMTGPFIREELTSAANVITFLTGMPLKPMWRPPYSSFDTFVLDNAAAVDYTKTIQFSRDTIDWRESTTAGQIVSRVVDPLPPDGTIVLLHLGGYHTYEALPWIITYLRDRGYTFTSVSDMLD